MNKIQSFYRQGFTLMELVIVLAIVMALFAIVLPTLFKSRTQSLIKQANIQIGQLEGNLELYATENRGYPTTEQGLYALIYFPDNQMFAMTSPNFTQQQNAMTPGMDPNAAFGGNAVAVGGAGTFGVPTGTPNPVANPMIDPTGMNMNANMNPNMNMANPIGTANPAGIANPMDPMNTMATANPLDPMSGTITNTWNQPFHNPQIYAQQRKRPTPYVDSDKLLVDPWGQPYRYDNSMQYNGLNRTGEIKPAIWSAGPDKRDGTEDDITNWDPNEAQQRIAQQQFQNGMATNSMDMMGNPMMNPMNPMDPTGAGMANPMNQPMAPAGMSGMPNQPGMVNPMGINNTNPINETGITQPVLPNPMSNPMPNPMPNTMPPNSPMPAQPMLPTQPM
ncbi:MAG: type II secretion system protein GspG [Planctomycetaceae bacterium]|nr:type II secretion system protein GspG [Planctomycetaceae bacterium]